MKITGTDQLMVALAKGTNLEDVKKVVKTNTIGLQNQVQRNTNVFTKPTGNLKRMVVISFEDGMFTGKVVASADYSAYPEYGTRYMSARPYFRPAFQQISLTFQSDMMNLLK